MKKAVSFRNAILSDLPFLLQLRIDTLEKYLLNQGIVLSIEEHRNRILHEFEIAEIILYHSQEIGFLKLLKNENEYNILQFQVDVAHQGLGIGTSVLIDLIAKANKEDAVLKLSVLKGNKAIRLYERLGFVKVDEGEKSIFMVKDAE